jgi:hypothetical protein
MTTPVTPLMKMALGSFRRARTALVKGRVDEMIGQLTRGVELLDVIDHCEKPSARRRSTRRSTS